MAKSKEALLIAQEAAWARFQARRASAWARVNRVEAKAGRMVDAAYKAFERASRDEQERYDLAVDAYQAALKREAR